MISIVSVSILTLAFTPATMGNNGLPEASTAILDKAWKDAEILSQSTSLKMNYGLYRGVSVLRSFSNGDEKRFDPSHYGLEDILALDDAKQASLYRAAAILFLLEGNLGASHEVLLGVTLPEIESAEYAATHPGQTSWAKDHPSSFTDTSDWIHSMLHRLEGPNLGEGNHTGYHNARYWALGGPKSLREPADHPLREVLAIRGPMLAPSCVARGLLKQNTNSDKRERIWDDLAFIDLCRLRHEGKLTEKECAEVVKLQQLEICALLHNELCLAHGLDPSIERTKD
mmetsp:Transcript_3174/g.7522  ORF Transcript_3174/g.7522 Transcript_3174/m.7522 type:complete len:285 (+) Transcript_3174:57-911(+)